MREWIMEQGIIFYFFCSAGVLGAAAAAAANHVYKRLIKEADAMENSEHRLIKYIKLKYSSYYTLGLKANDEKAMVKRYLYRYKIGPLTLMAWSKMGLAALGLVVLACMGLVLYGLNAGADFADMFSMIVLAAMVSLVLGMQYKLYGFRDKQSVFCAQMEDNLQNFLKNKIEYGHVLKRQSSDAKVQETVKNVREMNSSNMPVAKAEKHGDSQKGAGNLAYVNAGEGSSAMTNSKSAAAAREPINERREHMWHGRKAQGQAAAAAYNSKKQAKKAEDSIYSKAALQLADGFGAEEIDAQVVEDILKEFLN